MSAGAPRVVGLTGGIASGKSTVAEMLRRRGLDVIDADGLAREVVEPGRPALDEIVHAFGDDVLQRDGRLDRARLAAIVFADADARRRLEAITHPAIEQAAKRRVREAAQRGARWVFYEAALLVETGRHETLAFLVVVAAPRERQIERVVARDRLSPADAEARIDAQLPLEEKCAVADFVIDTAGDREKMERQVDAMLAALGDRC